MLYVIMFIFQEEWIYRAIKMIDDHFDVFFNLSLPTPSTVTTVSKSL